MGFPGGASGKEPAGPWRRYKRHRLGRSPGEEHGNPLQCSCLENPMDRGAWRATVYRVAQSQIRLKWHSTLVHTHSMLCYAKLLQSCPTLCDPIDGSHQAPPSMELSRQEYWSGGAIAFSVIVYIRHIIIPCKLLPSKSYLPNFLIEVIFRAVLAHSSTEHKIQRFSIYPLLPQMHTFSYYEHSPQEWYICYNWWMYIDKSLSLKVSSSC